MITVYTVFVPGSYDSSDMEFGTFTSEDEAERLRKELSADWREVEIAARRIWESVQEQKIHNAEAIAMWEANNPE